SECSRSYFPPIGGTLRKASMAWLIPRANPGSTLAAWQAYRASLAESNRPKQTSFDGSCFLRPKILTVGMTLSLSISAKRHGSGVISFSRSISFMGLLVEAGAGEIDPDPGLHVAAVVIAFAEQGVVIDFNSPFLLALIAGKFDDFEPPLFLGLLGTVRSLCTVCRRIYG